MSKTNTIKSITQAYYKAQTEYVLRYDLHPCTEEDILYLENEMHLRFPEEYRTFLKIAGRKNGNLNGNLFGSNTLPYHAIFESRDDAIVELISNNISGSMLPEDAIVFSFLDIDYIFAFIRASEGPNPPVWRFHEGIGSIDQPFTKVSSTFWEYLYDTILSESFGRYTQSQKPTHITQNDVMELVKKGVVYHVKREERPVSDNEIREAEQTLSQSLPGLYKEFLKWSGHGIPNLLEGYQWGFRGSKDVQSHILQIPHTSSPNNLYIFLTYVHGKIFDVFNLSEGDNPPIYRCTIHASGVDISKISDSFTDYLLEAIARIK